MSSVSDYKPAIIVHGGAGRIPNDEGVQYSAATLAAVRLAMRMLAGGANAVDVAVAAVQSMEEAPVLNAGYGSVLDENGALSFDASVMEGGRMAAGAIGAIPGIVRSPVALARLVMERHPSVFLAGEGALDFARSQDVEFVDPESMITDRQRERWRKWKEKAAEAGKATDDSGLPPLVSPLAPGQPEAETAEENDSYDRLVVAPAPRKPACDNDGSPSDTVGAVVRDASGLIASALSTGGVRGKPKGRIGDTPLVGCGLYAANELGGAASTGIGEDIIRAMLAGRAVLEIERRGGVQNAADTAVRFMLERIAGMAGVIMLDSHGNIGYAHSTMRMAVAFWNADMTEPVTDLDGNLIV